LSKEVPAPKLNLKKEKKVVEQCLICPMKEDMIISLPYWNFDYVFPCMFSGTINTKPGTDHNLFYWLFKNLDKTGLPLVLWLNGGPGSSSMFGLFLENGPLRVNKTGATDDDYTIFLNPEGSWNDVADMLYLDQPIGVGFSYGSPLLTQMQDGADEFVNFMLGFYEVHPDYLKVPFYITGESYAGKYIPIFA
jgi:carboxypeptidase C (cathepsin A)